MAIQNVGPSSVQQAQKAQPAQPGYFAKLTGRGGPSTQSTIAPAQPVVAKSSLAACVSNVFAAVRKCLSYIPFVGRLFVVKPAPVVSAPVAPKPSLSANVTNAALRGLATSKEFVMNHKALAAGVVSVGAAIYFKDPILEAGNNVVEFARKNAYFGA